MPEVRYFLILLSALEKRLPRDDIVFLLSSALFAWPDLALTDQAWVRDNAHLLSAIARKYRIISGKNEWENAFIEHERYPLLFDPLDDETDGAALYDRERSMARYITAARPVITGFLRTLADIPAEAPLSDYHERFNSLIDTYMRPLDGGSQAGGCLKELLTAVRGVSEIQAHSHACGVPRTPQKRDRAAYRARARRR